MWISHARELLPPGGDGLTATFPCLVIRWAFVQDELEPCETGCGLSVPMSFDTAGVRSVL